MSGIFGFINMDGRPASREHFQAMAEKMAHWGPDGVGSMITGNAAFGHALLIVTHESRFEKMPVYDQDEGIIFTVRQGSTTVMSFAIHSALPIRKDQQCPMGNWF